MSTFVLKNIEMTLEPYSIQKAIDEIQMIESQLKPAMTHLIDRLVEKGVEVARAELIFFDKPAFDTGELSNSIRGEMLDSETGVVATDVMYAVYVEYGTGEYASNGAGRQGGWTYFNDRTGEFVFTRGMAARPFMYNTMRDLEAEAEASGGRIIAEYLA